MTLVFENRDTIRFQVQEMARAEKIITDEGIQTELDIYNPLIPEPGTLSATLFIELTTKDELQRLAARSWSASSAAVELHLGPPPGSADEREPTIVPARPDPRHEAQLTRETITASVHYVHFALTAAEVDEFANGPVSVASHIRHTRMLRNSADSRKTALLNDLLG